MDKKILIFDFDGTLTPYPITPVKILEQCGYEGGMISPLFIEKLKCKMDSSGLDSYAASYELLFEILKENNILASYENFGMAAEEIDYNLGVYEFLEKFYTKGINNYLVSSSAKPFLEQTIVAKFFKDIFATTFIVDSDEIAYETDFLMTDEKKVDVIKKILVENGYDVDDCHNLIYVGDGLTDLCAMEYIKNRGGETIFVYLDNEGKTSAFNNKNIISYVEEANYSEDSDLFKIIWKLCDFDN